MLVNCLAALRPPPLPPCPAPLPCCLLFISCHDFLVSNARCTAARTGAQMRLRKVLAWLQLSQVPKGPSYSDNCKPKMEQKKNHFLLSIRSPVWSKGFCATYFADFAIKEIKERVVDQTGFKLVFVNCRRRRASQWKRAIEEYNQEVAPGEKIFWAGSTEDENIRTGECGRSIRASTAFKVLTKRDATYHEWSEVSPRKKRNTLTLLNSTLADPFKNPMEVSKRSPKLLFPSFNEDEIYKSLEKAPADPKNASGASRPKAKRAREQEYSTESGSDHSTESESEEERDRSPGIAELVRGLRSFEQRVLPPPSSALVRDEQADAELRSGGEERADAERGGEDREDRQDAELRPEAEDRPEDEDRQDRELHPEDEDHQDRELHPEDEDREDAELRSEDEDRELRADDDGFHAHIHEAELPPAIAAGDLVSLLNLGNMITPLIQSNTTLQNALIASNEKLLACKDEVIAVKDLLLAAKDNVVAARDELLAAKNELIKAQSVRLQG